MRGAEASVIGVEFLLPTAVWKGSTNRADSSAPAAFFFHTIDESDDPVFPGEPRASAWGVRPRIIGPFLLIDRNSPR
jgi:hypothetical protein